MGRLSFRTTLPPALLLPLLPLGICAAVVSARAGQQENQAYLPLSRIETNRRFPVRYVGTTGLNRRPGETTGGRERPLPERLDVGPSGALVKLDDEAGFSLSGTDRGGKPWRVLLGETASSYPCNGYTSDLDRDGMRDAVLVCPTGGNGLAPTSHFIALTFDARGRPVPFEADGYFQEDARGIFDLVDLDGNGRAELIYMNFSDGYWVTNLYEVGEARWRLVKGRHAQRSYPLYTRFTYRPNRRLATPKPNRKPSAPDLANDAPKLRGRLIAFRWADVSQSEDIELSVADERGGNNVVCKPVAWYGSFGLVKDAAEGRTVVTAYGNAEQAKSMLEEAARDGAEVRLYGQRSKEGCSPEWLWLADAGSGSALK